MEILQQQYYGYSLQSWSMAFAYAAISFLIQPGKSSIARPATAGSYGGPFELLA